VSQLNGLEDDRSAGQIWAQLERNQARRKPHFAYAASTIAWSPAVSSDPCLGSDGLGCASPNMNSGLFPAKNTGIPHILVAGDVFILYI
jgi:hypothetical protein